MNRFEPKKYGFPFPPSGNHRLGMKNGKSFKAKKYKEWLKLLEPFRTEMYGRDFVRDPNVQILRDPNVSIFRKNEEPLAVSVEFCPPDRRKRDLDNLLKTVFDGLQHARIVEDDASIKEVHATMASPDHEKRGFVVVVIKRMECHVEGVRPRPNDKENRKEKEWTKGRYTPNMEGLPA